MGSPWVQFHKTDAGTYAKTTDGRQAYMRGHGPGVRAALMAALHDLPPKRKR